MAIEDIRISLQLLAETVENLEQEVAQQAVAAKAQTAKSASAQPDMFSGWAQKPANDKNSIALAQKLDSTITKVQNLLKEASA